MGIRAKHLAAALLGAGWLTGCRGLAASPEPTPVHWEYAGDAGPAQWGRLSPDFAVCASGQNQSPIDVSRPTPQDLPNLVFSYQPAQLLVVNNGHTIQANVEPGSSLTLDGVTYNLIQFHFHHPSEHTLNGKAFDLEMHLVHKSADGRMAVVAVLIQPGAANTALQSLWADLPAAAGDERAPAVPVNAADLLPADRQYATYTGSLTTPPCTEGIKWLVLTSPLTFSAEQIGAFARVFPLNARPVQAGNARTVLEDSTP